MSVRRVMGTETEYGIAVPGQPGANAMVTSSQVVNAYQAARSARARRARADLAAWYALTTWEEVTIAFAPG